MPQPMHYDELDLAAIQSTGRLDANESIFFARELEYVKSKAYDVKYPANNALALFPVSTEADAGADYISYESYDMIGMAKIIANYADDLPHWRILWLQHQRYSPFPHGWQELAD